MWEGAPFPVYRHTGHRSRGVLGYVRSPVLQRLRSIRGLAAAVAAPLKNNFHFLKTQKNVFSAPRALPAEKRSSKKHLRDVSVTRPTDKKRKMSGATRDFCLLKCRKKVVKIVLRTFLGGKNATIS